MFGSCKNASPCEGGLEYFHRDPASCKRQRKGDSVASDERVMYGYEASVTLTTDRLY
jgi:hypothetical protein